jgi:glycerol kinase
MSIFLAVDQSTSATKAMLFSQAGQLLDQVALPHRQIYPQAGWVEHDADEIYQNFITVAGDLLAKRPDLAAQVCSLSITNQRETYVVFDRATGKPLHNAVVWLCRRGEGVCRRLAEGGHEARVHELTGLKIDTYFPASKLAWLLAERPDLAAQLASGEALFGTIDAYLIYRLTRGAVYATDHTNASRTLFYDITTLGWSDELLATFGVTLGRLPDIRESCAQFGVTDLEGRLPAVLAGPLPICGVMGDSQGAFFAQRCFTPGSAKITFGTGSSVLMNIGDKPVLSPSGIVTAIGWVLDGKPTYAFEGITNFTGATIAWLRDQLQLIDDVAATEAIAASVPDNGGVYLVPAFAGLSAPYWRPDVRATITGLSPSSTRAHVVRAALESIAFVVSDVLRLMEEDAGLTLQFVQGDGGAVRNRLLMQCVADVSRRTVRAARLPELSALGAVFNGMLGMGVATLDDLRNLPADYTEYTPRLPAEAAAQLLAGWKHAVQQTLT